MKKILFLTSTFPTKEQDSSPGFLGNLATLLNSSKYQVVVLAPHAKSLPRYEKMGGVTVYRFRYAPVFLEKLCYRGGILGNLKSNPFLFLVVPLLLICQFFNAWKIVKKEKISLIHAHWLLPSALVAVFLKYLTKLPLVITSHGSDVYLMKNIFFRLIAKFILKRTDHYIMVNKVMQKKVEKLKLKQKQPSCISMGVDTAHFKPVSKTESDQEKIILSVGRLAAEKGIDNLVQAMQFVLPSVPSVKLLVIGKGPCEKELKGLAGDIGLLNKHIFFLGAKNNVDLPKFYNRADVFVLSSLREGVPCALLEAMACACPVVVTDFVGAENIVENGVHALMAPRQKPKLLAAAIVKILNKEKIAKYLSANALKLVRERYDWSVIIKKHVDVYDDLAGN